MPKRSRVIIHLGLKLTDKVTGLCIGPNSRYSVNACVDMLNDGTLRCIFEMLHFP